MDINLWRNSAYSGAAPFLLMTASQASRSLIVNADDYGYFRCVSRGIIEAGTRGIVTATGVMANGNDLEEQAHWLMDCPKLDVGVHLNLTAGVPLTSAMRQKLTRWSGRFPGKYAISLAVVTGTVRTEDVLVEWQAQIERCIAVGLQPCFLNSHEHVHMLPPLFNVVETLAKRHGISHIRRTTAERPAYLSAGALLRNCIVNGLDWLTRRRAARQSLPFLGLAPSGHLDEAYLRRVLPTLQAGHAHELMCHPGLFDAREVSDARLLAYHDWQGELSTLTSPEIAQLIDSHGIKLIGYRDLAPAAFQGRAAQTVVGGS